MEPTNIAILIVAAFVAGWLDSQVGGGGVITLPALLAVGVPPHLALGTNKLAATGASTTASIQYLRNGLVSRRALRWIPVALLATAAGAWLVLQVPAPSVQVLVALVVIAMAAYVAWKPSFGTDEKVAPTWVRWLVVPVAAIAFYDGFLGPGTGTFLLFLLVASGAAFKQAAADGRVLNWASNAGALALFAVVGNVNWLLGGWMLIGTVAGGYLGSRMTIRGSNTWVRWLFVGVAVLLAGRLIWTQFG